MARKQPNFFKYAHEAKFGTSGEDGTPRNRVGSGWENFFTEAVAFFLQADRQALKKMCCELLGDRYESPERVETQVGAEDGTPDIAIWLESGRQCFIESKIDAPLGPGQPGKYLVASQDGKAPFVALFSRIHHDVPKDVLQHCRYLRPQGGVHYSWKHLYDWIRAESPTMDTRLRRYFSEYMEWLRIGWLPPGPWSRLFEDRTVPENAAVRDTFGERLAGVRNKLRQLEFKVTEADRYGLVGWPRKPQAFHHLAVAPRHTRKEYLEEPLERYVGPASLSVYLVYEEPSEPKHAEDMYREFGGEPFGVYRWVRLSPYRMTNGRWRLEFVADLQQFLADEPHEMAARLVSGCNEVLDRLSALMAQLR
jgi:hypothetical protein